MKSHGFGRNFAGIGSWALIFDEVWLSNIYFEKTMEKTCYIYIFYVKKYFEEKNYDIKKNKKFKKSKFQNFKKSKSQKSQKIKKSKNPIFKKLKFQNQISKPVTWFCYWPVCWRLWAAKVLIGDDYEWGGAEAKAATQQLRVCQPDPRRSKGAEARTESLSLDEMLR